MTKEGKKKGRKRQGEGRNREEEMRGKRRGEWMEMDWDAFEGELNVKKPFQIYDHSLYLQLDIAIL